MTDTTDAPRPGEGITPPEGEEVTPDYSRLGFRELRALCKTREIPADGSVTELIVKLKAFDAQRGLPTDVAVPEGIDDEEDLLADDEAPQAPAGGGEVASASPPAGPQHEPRDAQTLNLTGSGPATPAVTVRAAEDAPQGLPAATVRSGRAPNMEARDGLVRVGEGHGAAEVRAFRAEFPLGMHEVTDADHMRFIGDTHAAAWAAGYQTKGGVTVGERVGYAQDASGLRTVIYQVPIKRQR